MSKASDILNKVNESDNPEGHTHMIAQGFNHSKSVSRHDGSAVNTYSHPSNGNYAYHNNGQWTSVQNRGNTTNHGSDYGSAAKVVSAPSPFAGEFWNKRL